MKPHYSQPRKTDVALATVFAIYGLACGLIGFGFYAFMQPRYMANPGVVAYRPFPGTLINHPPTNELTYHEPPLIASVQQSQDALDESTTGQQAQAENHNRDNSNACLRCKKPQETKSASTKNQQVGSTRGELSEEVYCAFGRLLASGFAC
jgi:hypothetical protein